LDYKKIANLFSQDTYEALMTDMKPVSIKKCKGQVDADENVFNYFIGRVKGNHHVILCFTHFGEQFRS
jgi:dynein heavy chain